MWSVAVPGLLLFSNAFPAIPHTSGRYRLLAPAHSSQRFLFRVLGKVALSIASGLGKTAKSTDAKILRVNPRSPTRTEVPVNLKTILAGKTSDVALQAEDILYVPTSLKKDIALKTLDALGGAGVSGAIYRIP